MYFQSRKFKILIILLIVILLSGIWIGSLNFFRNSGEKPKPTETENKQALHSTGLFGEQVFWLDNNTIEIIHRETLIIKNLKNGKQKELQLPKGQFTVLSRNLICISDNFEISSPEQIATIIRMFIIENNELVEIDKIESNFTIKPINCSPEGMYFITSIPILKTKIYYQKRLDEEITEYPLSIFENISYTSSASGSYVLLIQDNHKIQLLDTINSSTKDILPLTGLSGISDIGNFYNFMCEPNRCYLDSSQKKDFKKIQLITDEEFVSLIPSPDEKKFTLLSKTGQIFILELN